MQRTRSRPSLAADDDRTWASIAARSLASAAGPCPLAARSRSTAPGLPGLAHAGTRCAGTQPGGTHKHVRVELPRPESGQVAYALLRAGHGDRAAHAAGGKMMVCSKLKRRSGESSLRVMAVAGLGLWLAACASDPRAQDVTSEAGPSGDQAPRDADLDSNALLPPRETCEDNAYLAGCEVAGNAGSAGVPQGAAEIGIAPPVNPPGDDFDATGTNPFVMVDHDPLSTFAVDVDTASYDVFRRDVEDGTLPAPASVRLEEYVNFFSYAYPTADAEAEQPFSISLAAAPSVLDTQLTVLRVGIQGKAPPARAEKLPTNLVFLVDVSGSMNQSDKLPLAQQVLR